ncbi:MAG: hypothetical protein UZ16_OP3001002783 [Candidatus Hinthialibacteria bacterium OLB16]|nr:MAG: hypothetical protein UZ16_OP3001002783 [Candidatus Hinthialibacteria bacterium OLB16]
MGSLKACSAAALTLSCLCSLAGFGQGTNNHPMLELAPLDDQRLWIAEGEPAKSDFPDSGSNAGKDAPSEAALEADSHIDITIKADWVSKYMFRGIDVLDDRGAYQPSVDIGLWDSGLHLVFWASLASSGRYSHGTYVPDGNGNLQLVDSGSPRTDELDEFDYTVYYTKSCLNDCLSTEVGMTYYDIFNQDSEKLDVWEWYGKFTLSKMPLQPHVYFYYDVPKRRANGGEGWMTCLGGSHSCELGAMPLFGSNDPVTLSFSGDVWYNGGGYFPGIDTGWTHAVFGSAMTIPLCHDLTFTPGIYYQISMEDTINKDDELWTQLSLAYSW